MLTKHYLAMACMIMAAAPAAAGVVFRDDFDSENGGVSMANYRTLTNWTNVNGTVDLMHDGDVKNGTAIQCDGGCLDLRTTPKMQGLLGSKQVWSASGGDRITIVVRESMDQVGTLGEAFLLQPRLVSGSVDFLDIVGDGVSYGGFRSSGINFIYSPEGANRQFITSTVSFNVGSDTSFRLYVGSANPATGSDLSDNSGPILDSIMMRIDTPGAVPEPASWAMMVSGFGMVGAAMRRSGRAVRRFG